MLILGSTKLRIGCLDNHLIILLDLALIDDVELMFGRYGLE